MNLAIIYCTANSNGNVNSCKIWKSCNSNSCRHNHLQLYAASTMAAANRILFVCILLI